MAKKKNRQANTKKSSRAKRKEQREEKKRRENILRISTAGIIVLVIAAIVILPNVLGSKAAPVDQARLILNPSIGPDTAPVVITEFADFGCHACEAWHHAGIKEQILEAYGDKVQFVWHDFPVITAQSPKAAEAGQCAFDQGKFWEYHDLVYESRSGLGVNALKSYAQGVGLDTQAFNTCLDSGQHQASVEHDLNEARSLRLRGTPSFMVNGDVLPGPPGYDQLVSLIDAELALSN